jgi:hypothetical protein
MWHTHLWRRARRTLTLKQAVADGPIPRNVTEAIKPSQVRREVMQPLTAVTGGSPESTAAPKPPEKPARILASPSPGT